MGAQYHSWKTASVKYETYQTVTIVFDVMPASFSFLPGQFINLTLLIEGVDIIRSYSLSNALNESPAITVKKVETGLMSQYIFANALNILEWRITGPFGSFFVNNEVDRIKKLVLIGGGSGITPLFAILKQQLANGDMPVWLMNCNKTPEEVIFGQDLLELEQKYPDQFVVWHFFSGITEGSLTNFNHSYPERINKLLLKKRLKSIPGMLDKETFFFLCGPEGLIRLSEEALLSMGIQSSQIRKEYFQAHESGQGFFQLPVIEREVQIHYREQTSLLRVPGGKSILEAALEESIPLNYSCKNGVCGVCFGKKTSGEVIMSRNNALTEVQLKAGYVLLCQSYPINDNVTIEVD